MSSEKPKRSGIVTLTSGGEVIARRLLNHLEDQNWMWFDRVAIKEAGGMGLFMKNHFQDFENWVFIGAAGIMIRSMAPYLIDKFTDPAVIVLDEGGKFVISLLSGHVGGANGLAVQIADLLEATPVVTTATDVNQRASLDLLLKALKCPLKPYRDLILEANRRIVAGETIGIYIDENYLTLRALETSDWLPQVPGFCIYKDWESLKDSNLGLKIYVGYCYQHIHKENPLKSQSDIQCVVPKCFILGTGVRKALDTKVYEETLLAWLASIHVSPLAVEALVSIDIKSSETCLLDTATKYQWQTQFYSAQEMLPYEQYFETSNWVRQTVGIGSVSGPAVLCFKNEKQSALGCEKQAVVKEDAQATFKGNGCTFTLGRNI